MKFYPETFSGIIGLVKISLLLGLLGASGKRGVVKRYRSEKENNYSQVTGRDGFLKTSSDHLDPAIPDILLDLSFNKPIVSLLHSFPSQ